MLFFRSEDRVREWCRAAERPMRPLVTIPQLWGLATAWYANRLERDARRPKPPEMRGIFARLGLDGEFWDPGADSYE
jgi:hypothetical protein